MNPRPPEGTPADTLHWLFRGIEAPHWMVATWTGEGWNTLRDRTIKPEEPDFHCWNYSMPAAPPLTTEANQRKSGALDCRMIVQKMLDEYTHEHGSYDGSTGVYEFSRSGEEFVETLDEILEAIDRRIREIEA